MRSEFQFFMAPQDQKDFLEFALPYIHEIDKSSKIYWKLFLEDCYIQFEPSRILDGNLISGRIAIATHGLDKEATCKNPDDAEKVYRKYRNWLKKRYSNKLSCYNIHKPESKQESKHFWIGPNAVEWKQKNDGLLKQFPNGFVVFEIIKDT
jgi:hypothetical protein